MNLQTIKTDALLLITAVIWGFAFVAQRVGMEYVGPFTFNGVRFALGSFVLLPLVLRSRKPPFAKDYNPTRTRTKTVILGGGLLGLTLYAAASLQQVGLVYTTAGKAGFITGLYVVIVPILGLFWRQRSSPGTWIGTLLAATGLYLLCITDEFSISFGDLLELLGAFLWAGHVLIIGWLSSKIDSPTLAFTQFAACSILSLITACFAEVISPEALFQAAIPIIYGGVLSVGVGYTLQVIAQRNAHPAHAAILLSMEAVFAAFGGWLILNEILTFRGLAGCALMFSGMLFSQLYGIRGGHTLRLLERDGKRL